MSLVLFMFALAGQLPSEIVQQCKDAVHSENATSLVACDARGIKLDLTSSEPQLSDQCRTAMDAGRKLGQLGPNMPKFARSGMRADFDKKMNACQQPAPKQEVKTRETVNLWD